MKRPNRSTKLAKLKPRYYLMLLLVLAQALFLVTPTVYADATSLTAPTGLTPADGAIVQGRQFTQTWLAVPQAQRYQYESYNDKQATQLRARQQLSGTTKTNDYIPSGNFWWRVRAVDAASSPGTWSTLHKVAIDNEPPTITPLVTIGNKAVQGMAKFVFESTDKHPMQITAGVYSDAPTVTVPVGQPAGNVSTKDVTIITKVTLNIDTTALPNGRQTIVVYAIDRAGNSNERRFYFTVANPHPGNAAPDEPQDRSPIVSAPVQSNNPSGATKQEATNQAAHPSEVPPQGSVLAAHADKAAVASDRVLNMRTEQGATTSSKTESGRENSMWFWIPSVAIFGAALVGGTLYAFNLIVLRKNGR